MHTHRERSTRPGGRPGVLRPREECGRFCGQRVGRPLSQHTVRTCAQRDVRAMYEGIPYNGPKSALCLRVMFHELLYL